MFQAYIKHVHSFLLIFPTTLMLLDDCNTLDQDRLFPVHTVHIHYNFLPPCGNKTVPYPGHKVHSHDRSEFYLPGTLHNHFRYLPPFHTIWLLPLNPCFHYSYLLQSFQVHTAPLHFFLWWQIFVAIVLLFPCNPFLLFQDKFERVYTVHNCFQPLQLVQNNVPLCACSVLFQSLFHTCIQSCTGDYHYDFLLRGCKIFQKLFYIISALHQDQLPFQYLFHKLSPIYMLQMDFHYKLQLHNVWLPPVYPAPCLFLRSTY